MVDIALCVLTFLMRSDILEVESYIMKLNFWETKMRGMQKAVVMLALLIGGVMLTSGAQAGAVEREDLETAIKKAELAVLMVKSPEFEAQRSYLREKVVLAKKMVVEFEKYRDANLGELVATLEEGARALRLTAGVDRREDEKYGVAEPSEAVPTAIVQQYKAEQPEVVVAAQEKKVAAATTNARATVKTEVAETRSGTSVAQEKGAGNEAGKATEAEAVEVTNEKVDGESESEAEEATSDEQEDVEVPRTGEAEVSPVAVVITVGVIVGLSAAGAVAIVKRMKRGL